MSDGGDLEPRHRSGDQPCTAGTAGAECVHCAGFGPGNELSRRHGAYANPAAFSPRAAEIAEAWRPLVPLYRPGDEPMLQLLALVVARLETFAAVINAAEDPTGLERLLRDERALVNRARQLLNDLGMSPTARWRLGVDVALTQRTVKSLTELAAELEAESDTAKEQGKP